MLPSNTAIPAAPPVAEVLAPSARLLAVGNTTLAAQTRGAGRTVLVVHGGGEDAGMLSGQAESLAAAGFAVITYDRRGTGRSGRESWPGGGAAQHADDAAGLLAALGHTSAVVLGVSSGGVIALALAARHPAAVEHVVAWEPPAAGVLPGGAALTDQIMSPVRAHLAAHPDDYAGAQALLLSEILGFPVSVDDPAFADIRANAEPMIRDEPAITLATFTAADLARVPITIAVGIRANEVVRPAVARLAELIGAPPVVLDADHEVYLQTPQVLTEIVIRAVCGPATNS